jgi:O-antigen/teichoic acid export membrane protein
VLKRLISRTLVRAGLVTYLFSALTLVANLVTGIVTARALGPSGRGIAAALQAATQFPAFLFSLGVAQSLSYFIARRPQDGPSLFTTWVLILLPLSAVAIGATELLLPTLFPNDEQAVTIGRWFLFTIVLGIGLELNYGLLLGKHDFFVYNLLRFLQPLLFALSLLVLWPLDALTVESTLIAATASTGLVLAAGLGRALRLIGLGPVAPGLGRTSVWFGVRGQGSTLATNVTARLDVAILPAYVNSASVGLYSVATNTSLIVYTISNTFAGLVLPAAARDPDRGPVKVIGALWASLVVAGVLALLLGLFARPLLGLVYGDDFRDAAEQLILILPGAVLFAGSAIVGAGVYAAGRPFTATLAQVLGMAVTIVGLLIFLPVGGITAAALVSTASYSSVFAAMLIAYKAVTGLPWGAFLPTPARVRRVLS